MHGLPARPLAVGLGDSSWRRLNAREKYSGSLKPARCGDLADREIGEAQQPRRLEHHALGDQVLGRAAGDVRQRARQGAAADAERIGVVRGVVVAREVLLERGA